jgi:hypothetical protein
VRHDELFDDLVDAEVFTDPAIVKDGGAAFARGVCYY